ncbi:protection of telomeres protein 1a-like [Euphorbia lathyris]|uniref:protection of telomeres protein 1a-like n=1 Tax=Euphorbia lathyris TaxID=212925 RepID=UPI003313D082
MGDRDDYKYLKIKDAVTSINQKVSLIGAVVEFGLPKKTKGTDWCCSLKIVDQTYPKPGMTVNIFASTTEQLPRISSLGDIVQLSNVLIKKYHGEVNAVFNKAFSYFSLYEGEGGGDFLPYQYSSRYYPGDQESKFIAGLRKWLADFHSDEGSNNFSFLREMRQGERTNLVCKVLHACEINEDEWMAFVWDGTDSPAVNIDSKLENERKNPLPLQLEPRPLQRDLLCTFPTVGTVLRVIIEKVYEKHVLQLLITGKWVKFLNILCQVREGLWCGMLTPLSKLRYVSKDIIIASERSYNARMTTELGRIPYWCFPWCSQLTEVDYEHAPFVTLMDVLTHSKVVSKFRSMVRVVAAFPWRAEDFCSHLGTFRIRLTIEDPTARLHAFLYAEDAEKFFGGYPSVDVLTRKRNTLLGVSVSYAGKEIDDAPRNPPWVQCCLKSYYLDKNDTQGTRHFRIFGTRHVG